MGLRSLLAGSALVVGAVMATVGCDALPDIDENVCGNKLVEPAVQEACDGFGEKAASGGLPTLCAPPGDRYQCQYVHDDDHDCPVGYGAGLDGLCRRGLAVFSEPISHTPATGSITTVADFDGDGRADILASNSLAADAKVVFFGNGGIITDTVPLSLGSALHAPIAARVGEDAAADVVLPSAAGLLLMRGKAGPTFSPKGYAPFELPTPVIPIAVPEAAMVPLPASAGLTGHYLSGTIAQAEDGLVVLAGSETLSVVAEIPGASLSEVMGVITTELDAPTPFTPNSDEIVIALSGDPGRLVVVTPHVQPGLRRVVEHDDFGPGRKLLRGPFRVDSRLGVAVGSEPNHMRWAQLLQLTGDDVAGYDLTTEELFVGRDQPTANDPILIGSYDLLVLRAVFVVLPDRLAAHFFTCAGMGGECFDSLAVNPSFYDWTAAAYDEAGGVVVAGSSLSTGLHLMRNNLGQPALATFSLSTEAPTQRLDFGDLDGDTVGDFLITSRGKDPGCDDDSRLSIAWGEQVGFPQSVVPLAEMPGLDRLDVATIVTSNGIDGASDIVLTTRCEDELRAGYFVGSTSRQLQSPYPLNDELPSLLQSGGLNAGDVPVIAADIGAKAGGPPDGVDDLLTFVGYPDVVSVRALFGGPDGALVPGDSLWTVAQIDDPLAQVSALSTARAQAVNLDDDEDLELVVVLSHAEDAGGGLGLYRPHLYIGDWSGGELTFTEAGASEGVLTWAIGADEAITYAFAAAITTQLVVDDFDGDDRLDVGLRLAAWDLDAVALEPSSYVTTFLARDDGYVEAPFPAPEAGVVRAMTSVDGRIGDASFAIATESELSLCGPKEGALACTPALSFDDDGVIVGVAFGDFDADGVADVALARKDGISMYRQLTAQDGVARAE